MSQAPPSRIKRFKKWSVVFLISSAGVTLVALFLWLFGAPGVEGEYARGWKLGFGTLIFYLMGCLVIFVAHFVTAIATHKFPVLDFVNTAVIGLFWVLFVYSVVDLYRAIAVISSAN